MLRKLDVVEILVKDWPAAVQWYTEKLGLQIRNPDKDWYADDQWCRLSFPEGDSALALYGRSKANLSLERRQWIFPIILVDDLEETVRELQERGVTFTEPIRSVGKGERITTLLDCEGNELQLIVYA